MKLSTLMGSLNEINVDNGRSKTASARTTGQQSSDKKAQAEQELMAVLNNAIAESRGTKSASVSNDSAVGSLVKMANDLASCENELARKEAAVLGAAFTEGAIARMQGYNGAGIGMNMSKQSADINYMVKEAEEMGYKQAAATINMVKEAEEIGYQQGAVMVNMLKEAEDMGYQHTMQQLHALRGAEQQKQAQDTSHLLQKIAHSENGQQKIAAIEKGYQDKMAQLNKTAQAVFDTGYVRTLNILRNMR